MPTYNDIIQRAFSMAGIKSTETALEDDEINDAYDRLVDMLHGWQDSGLNLGFVQSLTLSDDIGLPRVAIAAVKSNLAGRLAAEYEKPVSISLAASIDEDYKDMLRGLVKIKPSKMPGLSKGSGNWNYDAQDFYDDPGKKNF